MHNKWLQEAHVAVGATFEAWSIFLPKAETLAPLKVSIEVSTVRLFDVISHNNLSAKSLIFQRDMR